MSSLPPRAREEIVRPRRLSGVVVRPLNFTVRSHLREFSAAKSPKRLRSARSQCGHFQTRFLVQASSLGASEVRVRPYGFDQGRGARPSSFAALIGRACGDTRQARARVIDASRARLLGNYVADLKLVGRTRTVPLGRVTSNNRSREP